MTNSTGTRDKKVYNRCILGALGSTHGGKWGIIRFLAVPRCIIYCSLECSWDDKVYNRCTLGTLGSFYWAKWSIS